MYSSLTVSFHQRKRVQVKGKVECKTVYVGHVNDSANEVVTPHPLNYAHASFLYIVCFSWPEKIRCFFKRKTYMLAFYSRAQVQFLNSMLREGVNKLILLQCCAEPDKLSSFLLKVFAGLHCPQRICGFCDIWG